MFQGNCPGEFFRGERIVWEYFFMGSIFSQEGIVLLEFSGGVSYKKGIFHCGVSCSSIFHEWTLMPARGWVGGSFLPGNLDYKVIMRKPKEREQGKSMKKNLSTNMVGSVPIRFNS